MADVQDGTRESALKWIDAIDPDYLQRGRDAVAAGDYEEGGFRLREIIAICQAALDDISQPWEHPKKVPGAVSLTPAMGGLSSSEVEGQQP